MSTQFRRLVAAALATLIAPFVILAAASAQDPKPTTKPDDDIDKLLQSVGGGSSVKLAPAPKAKGDVKPKPDGAGPKGDKTKGEVDKNDKDIDDLLGTLGETKEKPSADDTKKPGPKPPDDGQKPPAKPGAKDPNQPGAQDKPIDERLEELTGRAKKKKNDDSEGESKGAMGELVKQMRDVEQRLKQTDTGEQTRQRQAQIIKNVEQMIEESRMTQMQQKSKKPKPGDKPGQPKPNGQPGQQPGALANGPPASKPDKPTARSIMNQSKDIWGHLDAKLREDMANIFKEEPLPAKDELIKRYYLAVSKKSLSRED